MATEKGDPRLATYRDETRRGVKNLTRRAAASPESRLAPKTHWEERWIGVISRYPKTPEAFAERRERGRAIFARLRAEGRAPTRAGVPDGWKGRKGEIAEIKAQAKTKADEAVARLIANGTLPVDEEAGNAALRVAFELMLDETLKTETRLKAAGIITDFTKPKPRHEAEVVVTPAEEWLSLLHSGNMPDVSN